MLSPATLLLLVASGSAATTAQRGWSSACQEALDTYCNVPSNCLSKVSFKGPLHALRGGGRGDVDSTLAWRCYGEKSLDSTFTHYTGGSDYCTRDAELAAINDAAPCNGTAPSVPATVFSLGYGGQSYGTTKRGRRRRRRRRRKRRGKRRERGRGGRGEE